MSTSTNDQGGADIRIPVGQVIDQIHNRYAKSIAMLVQENAELAAGQEAALVENAELKAMLAAMQPSDRPVRPQGRPVRDDPQA